jgi:hypothetical protein
MARPYGSGRSTCESCKSIDVRHWHRAGRLRPGQYFSWSWTCGGEPSGNISVRAEQDAVVLMFRSRTYGDCRVEVRRTASANHLDGMPSWRSSPLVHMLRLFRWALLRASRRVAVCRRAIIRMPTLLWFGI